MVKTTTKNSIVWFMYDVGEVELTVKGNDKCGWKYVTIYVAELMGNDDEMQLI